MQARPKILKIFVVALIASLVLAACGGGTTGATWFNLPSIPLQLQETGTLSVFGLPVTTLNPALVQQLQGANVQKMEVRIGYNGIHIYANGVDLPYISWDAESLGTLQDVLRNAPNIPNGALIANALPVLRQVGLGVALNLPSAAGANLPAWSGETTAATDAVDPAQLIGPFQIGSVAFDEAGNLQIGSVAGSALGLNGPLLDANTLAMLNSFGIDKLNITTEPNALKLSMNDRPLPSLAYDSASLAQVQPLVASFAPALAPTLEQFLPKLQNAQLDVAVSFTGQPAGETQLAPVPVALNADGTLTVFGTPLSSTPMVPADLLQKLQAAGVQQLDLEIGQDGIFLAADGQTLPTITWTPESMTTLAAIVGPLAGVSSEMISSGLAMIKETGAIKASIAMPGATATAAEINKTLATPDTSSVPQAVIHANATYSGGSIQSIAGLPEGAVPGFPLALPPNVSGILDGLDADTVALATEPGKLNLLLDGATALTINYDDAALQKTLDVASPFLVGTPLENPAMMTLVREQIMPLVPAADLDITVALQ